MILIRRLYSDSYNSYINLRNAGINDLADKTESILDWSEKNVITNNIPERKKDLIRKYTKSLKKLYNNKKKINYVN